MKVHVRRAGEIVWPRKAHISSRGHCVTVQFAVDDIHVAVRQRGRTLA